MAQRLAKSPRIVVANLKGGTGKTTLATAAALHLGALLVDLDGQGDAADWASRSHLVAAKHAPDWQEALAAIQAESGPVVIDCPPGEGPAMRAALSVATVVVVPTKSSAQDLRAVGRMLSLAERARATNPPLRIALVLNETKANTLTGQEDEDALRKLKGSSFLGTIRTRQAIPDAFRRGVPIPYGPARDEMMAILDALSSVLRRS
jgi:chromosome partitioning protein